MDVAGTAPGTATATATVAGIAPWVVLGAVLGIVLAALAGRAAGRLLRPRRARPSSAPVERRDDLPGFREAPPGFPGARPLPRTGWVALAPPAAAPSQLRRAQNDDRPVRLLAGLAVGVLLLIGAAALVAGLSPGRAAADRPRDGAVLDAEVRFAGLVLERRAVGVTVTTPMLRLTDGRAVVRLPTWNCLDDEAPADPEAAGCARSRTEYAELARGALDVERHGAAVRVSGRFPTSTRPNGGPPEETGRAYDLEFTLRTDSDDVTGDGITGPGVTGEVRLGEDSAPTRRG